MSFTTLYVTRKRVTLYYVNLRNVTLALPEDTLRRLKIAAAKQETSISAMLTALLERLANEEDGYDLACRELISEMKKGYDLGTHGEIGWTRDSIHER